jgi:hypothetical protein
MERELLTFHQQRLRNRCMYFWPASKRTSSFEDEIWWWEIEMRLGLDQSPSQHGQCGTVPGRFPLQDDVVGAFLLHWIFTCTNSGCSHNDRGYLVWELSFNTISKFVVISDAPSVMKWTSSTRLPGLHVQIIRERPLLLCSTAIILLKVLHVDRTLYTPPEYMPSCLVCIRRKYKTAWRETGLFRNACVRTTYFLLSKTCVWTQP